MYRNRDEITTTMKHLFQVMIDVAQEDGVISKDEEDILNKIKEGIENLETQLIQILESGLDDEEFYDLQHQILLDIVHNATVVAEKDGIVTEDEKALIDKLKELIERGL